jgi:hypothetical protein
MMRTHRLGTFALLLLTCVTLCGTRAIAQIAPLDAGTTSGNEYINTELGFRYQFPGGWFVNDTATQEKEVAAGHQVELHGDTSTKASSKGANSCTKNLLFVTQHPPGMGLMGFDSSVFLLAVDPKCIKGAAFPTSVKDHEGVRRTAKQIQSHLRKDTVTGSGPLRVRAFDNGGRVMIELSQPLNISLHERGNTTTQSINSSILLMEADPYWVMWWFTSDTDYNLERLRETKIFFDAK